MSLVKVKRFAQVTIPAAIRRQADIDEGDYVEVSYQNRRIVLTPKHISDKTVDWSRRFDDALAKMRRAAKRARITTRKIDEAVDTVRRRRGG